jgi:hypothetical protein
MFEEERGEEVSIGRKTSYPLPEVKKKCDR